MTPLNKPFAYTYHISTFGCQMNVHDSEHIAGVLESAGYTRAPSLEEAGVVIFNTCCVRESAENRVWGTLTSLPQAAGGAARVAAMTGCMAQLHGLDALRRCDTLDVVFGTGALQRLPELLERGADAPLCDLGDLEGSALDDLPESRAAGARAWVPVSHGCDNKCSYCVVPEVRGRARSRSPVEVIAEVERLASQGVLEVTLLGQNVNSYGSDIVSADFASLLEAVAGVGGIRRVKFETSHPRDLTGDVMEVMARADEVCEHLHLPVQSGSDRVLAAMRRGYGRDHYMELVDEARSVVPGLSLTTDLIVGFPGETAGDFDDTLDLVRRVRFDAAYTFMYSDRPGTAAESLEGKVPDEEKHLRLAELARLQAGITAESLGKVVGKDVEVLLEGVSRRGGWRKGRSRGHQVVLLPDTHMCSPLVTAHIHDAGEHALRGTVIETTGEDTETERCER